VESCDIGLVFAELDLVRPVEMDRIETELSMLGQDIVPDHLQRRLSARGEPAPVISEPDLRQYMDRCLFGPAIVNGEPQEDILGTRLGILDIDIEVAVVVEDAGIDDLEFELLL